jgi:hypothetical protein
VLGIRSQYKDMAHFVIDCGSNVFRINLKGSPVDLHGGSSQAFVSFFDLLGCACYACDGVSDLTSELELELDGQAGPGGNGTSEHDT